MKLINEPMATYLARKETSGGQISTFLESRRGYFREVVQGKPAPPPSEDMEFGILMHEHVVPHGDKPVIAPHFAVAPRRQDLDESLFGTPEGAKLVDRRTTAGKKAWAEFQEQSQDKTIITPDRWDRAPRILRALKAHPAASSLLWGKGGMNERTGLFTEPETGRNMRVRFDRIYPDDALVVEFKLARSLDPRDIQWDWYKLGYQRKAAIYLDALYALAKRNGVFAYVFAENSDDPEPEVAVYMLQTDNPVVQIGRFQYQDTIRAIQACEASGDWRPAWVRGEADYPIPGPVLREYEFKLGQAEDGPAVTMDGVAI